MRGMVVAPQPIAVEEGAKVLKEGGNAIDAAVTMAFVQGVVTPQSGGIGGFGQFHIYMSQTGERVVFDFHGRAGSRARAEMWADRVVAESYDGYGYILRGHVNDIGYKSVTVPGTVLGLYECLTRYGTWSWERVIRPAIRWAGDGFPVPPRLATSWQGKSRPGHASPIWRLTATPAAREIYTRDGEPYREGEILVQRDMARTLERIAAEGPKAFYRGEMAELIAADFEERGGLITAENLAQYRVRIGPPISTSYRGYEVASIAPPGGGATLIEMLNILEGYDLASLGHNSPDYIYLVSQAMKAAYTDRANLMGDPDFVEVPTESLISKERAAAWRERIDCGEKIEVPRLRTKEGPSTTHLSAMDRWGNAAALTHSLGSSSGVVTEGLGFMFNNCMNAFHPLPGHPNSIAPGKSRVTGMSPTIIYKGGRPFMVIGAPGGVRIITGNLQTILNVLDHGMTAQEAVSAPRFDCQEVLEVEARIPSYICAELERQGEKVVRSLASYGSFASVHAILVDPDTGELSGGADPRGEGMALSE